jgi:hypothetical protein
MAIERLLFKGGSGKRQLADGLPIRHRQSLRPCRCHPDAFHVP